MAIWYGTTPVAAPAPRGRWFEQREALGASCVAVLAAATVLAVVVVGSGSAPVALVSFGFDSNMPVQWDSDASSDLGDLSRYYRSPSADMGGKLKARTIQLAEVPARTTGLGESSDWDMKHWSKKHLETVEKNGVDDASVKGIWHSKGEAWAGIDELFPTADSPYAYQTSHYGKGEEAKMEAFLEHARHELRVLAAEVPAHPSTPKERAAATALTHLLAHAQHALHSVEEEVAAELAAARASPLPSLRMVTHKAAHHHQQQEQGAARQTHYESAEAAAADLASYFAAQAQHTSRLNRRDARKAALLSPSSPPQMLPSGGSGSGGSSVAVEERLGRVFASALGQGLEAAPEGASEGCSLCVKIFGCMDCCEPVCTAKDDTPAPPPAASSSATARARAAAPKEEAQGGEERKEIGRLAKEVAGLKAALLLQQQQQQQQQQQLQQEQHREHEEKEEEEGAAGGRGLAAAARPRQEAQQRADVKRVRRERREEGKELG
eukprot:CAMPEP_0177695496 /NCGR_PEP_ID=MMETSP0484_2-20121128/3487_1 /TAXON_ID=354590 /ORGANISM="Rhodomonas lens, Strain RHODO" /LENGTH=493 /DNA_ID=CAMNT_0019206423 /DNA_START=6 /DNA_END=1483 /DNA_ORIENTATION=+